MRPLVLATALAVLAPPWITPAFGQAVAPPPVPAQPAPSLLPQGPATSSGARRDGAPTATDAPVPPAAGRGAAEVVKPSPSSDATRIPGASCTGAGCAK